MIVPVLVALFSAMVAALSLGLSATAGRLPLVVALATLALTVAQALLERRRADEDPQRPGTAPPPWRTCLLLLGGLYVAGFLVALPLFAAWSWRQRPAAAAAAAGSVLAALTVLSLLQMDLYPGLLWRR